MGNIMNLTAVRNKPSRDGYDLSQKINFTAKVGELMPVWWTPVLPTDSLRVKVNNFIRTQSLNSAAFARMRGYFDFYFVPFSQMWQHFNTAVTQMNTNLQYASGPVISDNKALSGQLPYFTCEQVAKYIISLGQKKNAFGFFRSTMTCRLLEYLGYGNFYPYDPNGSQKWTWDEHPMLNNLALSPFSLMAYQKIYADYNRYTQWERTNPSTFNMNYITGYGDLNLDLMVPGFTDTYNFLDLRYSNWQKDLFHGVLPVAQYGEASVVPLGGEMSVIPNNEYASPLFEGKGAGVSEGDYVVLSREAGTGGFRLKTEEGIPLGWNSPELKVPAANNNLSLSVLALRRAEASQKWKEVSLASEEDYPAQIGAHWGEKPSDFLSGMCRYLGGITSNLDINTITNTNLADDNAALQRATGTFNAAGGIKFDSAGQYGIVMCVFRALPILDYTTTGVYFGATLTDVTDFPIPEFDRIGMESVPVCRALNPALETPSSPPIKADTYFGYAPRYIDWKTAIDVSRGEFTNTLESFVMKFNDDDLLAADSVDYPDNPNVESDSIKAGFFKVNPHTVDTLFAVDADKADHLLCSTFFDVKVVRSLDKNGLPY
jgi:hypothetical protein